MSTDRHLFDANISIEQRTLAYSDATLLEGHRRSAVVVGPRADRPRLQPAVARRHRGVRHRDVRARAAVDQARRRGALVSAMVFTMAPYRLEHFASRAAVDDVDPLAFWPCMRFRQRPLKWGMLASSCTWLQVIVRVHGVFLTLLIPIVVAGLAVYPHRAARAAEASRSARSSRLVDPAYMRPRMNAGARRATDHRSGAVQRSR